MIFDHQRFFEQVTVFIFCQRLQIVFDLATDERFAAQVFRAFSATARLRLIAKILALRVVKPSGSEPPASLAVVQ